MTLALMGLAVSQIPRLYSNEHTNCYTKPHNCARFVSLQPKKGGGLSYNSTVPLTHCSEKLVQLILHEYSILHSACIRRGCVFLTFQSSGRFMDLSLSRFGFNSILRNL